MVYPFLLLLKSPELSLYFSSSSVHDGEEIPHELMVLYSQNISYFYTLNYGFGMTVHWGDDGSNEHFYNFFSP